MIEEADEIADSLQHAFGEINALVVRHHTSEQAALAATGSTATFRAASSATASFSDHRAIVVWQTVRVLEIEKWVCTLRDTALEPTIRLVICGHGLACAIGGGKAVYPRFAVRVGAIDEAGKCASLPRSRSSAHAGRRTAPNLALRVMDRGGTARAVATPSAVLTFPHLGRRRTNLVSIPARNARGG